MEGLEGLEVTPYLERKVLNNPQHQHLLPYVVVTANEYEDYEVQEDGKLRH